MKLLDLSMKRGTIKCPFSYAFCSDERSVGVEIQLTHIDLP